MFRFKSIISFSAAEFLRGYDNLQIMNFLESYRSMLRIAAESWHGMNAKLNMCIVEKSNYLREYDFQNNDGLLFIKKKNCFRFLNALNSLYGTVLSTARWEWLRQNHHPCQLGPSKAYHISLHFLEDMARSNQPMFHDRWVCYFHWVLWPLAIGNPRWTTPNNSHSSNLLGRLLHHFRLALLLRQTMPWLPLLLEQFHARVKPP